MSTTPPADETVSVRRVSWADLYRMRPDLRSANDNQDVDRACRLGGGVSNATGACSASTSATARP